MSAIRGIQIPVIAVVLGALLVGPAAAQTKVVMPFASWQWGQPGYDEFWKAAMAEFTKRHPNVTFQPVPYESGDYTNQMIIRFSAKNPPEIVKWTQYDFHTYVEAGWLDPLDERLRETDILQTWLPEAVKFTRVRGKQYGITLAGMSLTLMYNKRMFSKAGVEVPTTPQQFVEAAKKLTLRDSSGRVTQYGLAIVSRPADVFLVTYALSPIITGFGGAFAKAGKPTLNTPQVLQAMKLYKELFDAGVFPKGLGRIDTRQYMWEGKAAMIIEGPWLMTSIKQMNPSLLADIGVASNPFPVQVSNPSNGMAIARDQKHKDLAWEFIKMVMSPEWSRIYGEYSGVIPGRSGAISQRASEKFPWIGKFAELAAVGRMDVPEGLEAHQNQLYKIMYDRLPDALFGAKPIETTLKEIQEEAERLVKSPR